MVALQILVLSVWVRVLAKQHERLDFPISFFVFCLLVAKKNINFAVAFSTSFVQTLDPVEIKTMKASALPIRAKLYGDPEIDSTLCVLSFPILKFSNPQIGFSRQIHLCTTFSSVIPGKTLR